MSWFNICSEKYIVFIVGPEDDVHTGQFTLPMTLGCTPLWNGEMISWRFDKTHLKQCRNQFNVREIGKKSSPFGICIYQQMIAAHSLPFFLFSPYFFFLLSLSLSLSLACGIPEGNWLTTCLWAWIEFEFVAQSKSNGFFFHLLSLFWNRAHFIHISTVRCGSRRRTIFPFRFSVNLFYFLTANCICVAFFFSSIWISIFYCVLGILWLFTFQSNLKCCIIFFSLSLVYSRSFCIRDVTNLIVS